MAVPGEREVVPRGRWRRAGPRTALIGTGRNRPAVDDLKRLYVRRANPADVERLLGVPDERGADGSLKYEEVKIGSGHQGETLTIRFTDGVISRICRRSRS